MGRLFVYPQPERKRQAGRMEEKELGIGNFEVITSVNSFYN
jgi:hypothetical protein